MTSTITGGHVRQQRSATAGLAQALLSAIAFATSGVFGRSLMEAGWSAQSAVIARVGVAAVVLAVPAALTMRGRWHLLRPNLGVIGTFGLLAIAAAQACFFNAVEYLPIGVALLLEYLGIVLVVGWTWVVQGQRPRQLTVAGSVAAILGLALILDLTGGGGLDPIGVLWGLGAAVGLAGYFVLSARGESALPPVALAAGGMAVGTALLVVLGLLGTLPLRATFGDVTFAGHRTSWIVPVLGLSLVAAIVAYVAGIGATRTLGARLASFVGLTEVMFAVLIAWLALGELPTAVQLLGGVLILAGVALVRLDGMRPAPTGSGPARSRRRQVISGGAEPELVA